MLVSLKNPAVILVFGTNCTGKSTVGRARAGQIERCTFIELDELLHMIVSGVVGYSASTKPWEEPEEYKRQCELGLRNAVLLANSFADAGFSSVLEGLEDHCLPGSDWARTRFPDRQVLSVAALCDDATFTERWRERGWPAAAQSRPLEQRAWYRDNAALFDAVVDTSDGGPAESARSVLGRLRGSQAAQTLR